VFPSSLLRVPQDVPKSTTFLSCMLGPKLNFHIFYIKYKGGKKGRTSMLLFWGVPNLSIFFWWWANQSGFFKRIKIKIKKIKWGDPLN
jgi:hypothetical protein